MQHIIKETPLKVTRVIVALLLAILALLSLIQSDAPIAFLSHFFGSYESLDHLLVLCYLDLCIIKPLRGISINVWW
ncbi:hypothetical protein ACVRY7_05295 [Streptococcus ictaluri]|uniref:Uncharacterized protein n=1 Tax=Streptococcus ictaluri 707-05 TaxID=764299 RepID=G5K1W8_9STRE|nr:hypothetical protein [Streptococcus ictaluri]EHI70152.1 hypothetical protein STRIC_2376 [Streptococcus ictaluri 707-05]